MSCSRAQHSDPAHSDSRTSNPSIPSLNALPTEPLRSTWWQVIFWRKIISRQQTLIGTHKLSQKTQNDIKIERVVTGYRPSFKNFELTYSYQYSDTLEPGPEVIFFFSCSTQLSRKFILLIMLKCQHNYATFDNYHWCADRLNPDWFWAGSLSKQAQVFVVTIANLGYIIRCRIFRK